MTKATEQKLEKKIILLQGQLKSATALLDAHKAELEEAAKCVVTAKNVITALQKGNKEQNSYLITMSANVAHKENHFIEIDKLAESIISVSGDNLSVDTLAVAIVKQSKCAMEVEAD